MWHCIALVYTRERETTEKGNIWREGQAVTAAAYGTGNRWETQLCASDCSRFRANIRIYNRDYYNSFAKGKYEIWSRRERLALPLLNPLRILPEALRYCSIRR